jgi:transcriptional regulator with XRE-family HTH domain
MPRNEAPPAKVWTELRVIRTKDGHSLASLARAAVDPDTEKPMSLGYLSDLENGKREPNPRIIKRLAQALNVPVSMLEKRREQVPA